MSMLVVYLVAALGCSVAEGATVSKCDLKQKLTDKLGDRPENSGVNGETLVAKIVCHVEHASNFNTSAVNELTIGTEHNRRKRRDAGLFDLAEFEEVPTTAPARKRRDASDASSESIVLTLYGLFQLSNRLACQDGTIKTSNTCGIACDKLVDDDIEDDIDCVLTLFKLLVQYGFTGPNVKDLLTMIKLILQDECRDIQPSVYFADCP